MSNINKNNYEAFLLDYMEQNLAPDMVAELMLFLEQNPELKAELEDMEELAVIEASTIEFPNKTELKKEGLENLMIAEVEGINSPAESKELQKIVSQDQEAEKAFVLFQKTKLAAEPVVYADKDDLKRKEGKVIPLYWWVSSAAAILIMVFFFRGLNSDSNNEQPSNFANTNPIEEKQPVNTGQEVLTNEQEFASNEEEQSTDHINEVDNTHAEEPLLANESSSDNQELVANNQKPEASNQQPVIINEEPEQEEQQLATNNLNLEPETLSVEKDSILIAPMHEEEVLYAENETPVTNKKSLTIPQFLKKEVNQRILNDDNPQKNKPAEVVVADILAKAAGRKGSVDKTKNEEGEVEEYALNIGGFSFSRKVRK